MQSRSSTPSGRPVQAMSAAHALHFQIPKLPTPTPPSLLKRNASTGSSAKRRSRGASASEAEGSPEAKSSNSTPRRTSSPTTASLPSSPSFPPVSLQPSVSVQHLSHRLRASAMSASPLPSSSSPALSAGSSRDSDGSISPVTPRTPLSPRVPQGYTSRALAAAAPTSSPRRPAVKRRDTPIYTANLSPVFPKQEQDIVAPETTSTLDSEINEFDQHFGTAPTIVAAAGQ